MSHNSGVFHSVRIAAFVMALAATAQFGPQGPAHRTDLPYDGQFAFVRLRWVSDFGSSGWSLRWRSWVITTIDDRHR